MFISLLHVFMIIVICYSSFSSVSKHTMPRTHGKTVMLQILHKNRLLGFNPDKVL